MRARMLTSLEIVVERKNGLRGELYFGFNVIQKSSSDIYFLNLVNNRNQI